MAKRSRGRIIDDLDEDSGLLPRSRKPATYNEDELYAMEGLEDDVLELGKIKSDEDKDDFDDRFEDEDDDDEIPRKRNRKKTKIESEDDEFFDDDVVSDDDFIEKLQQKQFVATDEDDEAADYGYGDAPPKKRKKTSRSRSRSIEPVSKGRMTRSGRFQPDEFPEASHGGDVVAVDTDEEDDIKKEIAELYDSSPVTTPIKHKLRERGHKIDYTIPPPLTNDGQLDSGRHNTSSYMVPKGRGRRPNVSKNEYRKILFPTAGPFGGSDVISLFGTNIPPGGIPIPGMTSESKLNAIGQNVSDSDSSEDEIAPINGEATITKKPIPGASVNNTKLITAGSSSNDNDKKKNNLSDTDPLGVDMNIDFSVVGGLDNYINQLKEMVALPLLYPELYQNFAITPPRGVLFHGPPGTGKTLMARALAASCSTDERKITFFMRKGADCLSKWVGEAERQLRLLFEEAKNQQPSIIFFDEIDGLAPVRSSKQEQIHASIVSTLLALMDGMDNRGQVIVIGATNRPDSIDPALRRPGRFDREFYFPLPDINSRKEILKIHTRKWTPPIPDPFIEKIADLTKGYGGADLRALCTEAALHSIQRKYPQIYTTNDKLLVNPSKVKVVAKDFMKAIEIIVPSSARSTSTGSAPLPDHLRSLLESGLEEVIDKLNTLLPNTVGLPGQKKLTALDEALYLDPSRHDEDGGFSRQQLLRNLESARICKPHLLIGGNEGNGQQYISAAVLNYLEGFQVQSLDMGTIFGDPTRTPELSIVQAFIEARRHQPSIIFIPNIDIWFQVVPYSARATLMSLLRNLKSNEKVLLLGVSETSIDNLDSEIKFIFGFNNTANNVNLSNPSAKERSGYFDSLKKTLLMKPFEFINDLENRPKRKLKTLKVVKNKVTECDEVANKKKLKLIEYNDAKLKNLLKIKLAALMELFKNRYKRFKKPIIDENLLYHLFEPSILDAPLNQYEVLYVKSDDPNYENMIRELSTGRYYYNMDLDIVEERLWNGFYSEPKQFLKDIKLIVKDSITSGDRERILKANEMLTNAQFGIDEISSPELAKSWKELRIRELERQEKILKEHKALEAEFKKKQLENINNLTNPVHVLETVPEVIGEMNSNGTLETSEDSHGIEKVNGTVVQEILENGTITENAVSENEVNNSESVKPEDAIVSEEQMVDSVNPIQSASEQSVNPIDSNGEQAVKPIDSNGDTQVVDSKESDVIMDDVSKPTDETKVESESESESEAEEEFEIQKSRDLILGDKLDSFFDHELIELTENYNVEKLEIVMAKLMDIIWMDRNNWDKTNTIEKLVTAADSIRKSLSVV